MNKSKILLLPILFINSINVSASDKGSEASLARIRLIEEMRQARIEQREKKRADWNRYAYPQIITIFQSKELSYIAKLEDAVRIRDEYKQRSDLRIASKQRSDCNVSLSSKT